MLDTDLLIYDHTVEESLEYVEINALANKYIEHNFEIE